MYAFMYALSFHTHVVLCNNDLFYVIDCCDNFVMIDSISL